MVWFKLDDKEKLCFFCHNKPLYKICSTNTSKIIYLCESGVNMMKTDMEEVQHDITSRR